MAEERRQERRSDRREERRDDWEDYDGAYYYDDDPYYYDDMYYEDPYGYEEEESLVYRTLPCNPNSIVLGGVIYYTCRTTWFVRVYFDGEVAYTEVPNPAGQ